MAASACNSFTGTITKAVSSGALTRVIMDRGFTLIALVTSRSADELDHVQGKEVYASFKATAIRIIKILGI